MFEPSMETSAGHAQQFGRLRLVSLGSFHRPPEQFFLDLFQKLIQHDRILGSSRVRHRLLGPADLVGQVPRIDQRAVRCLARVCHDIGQLIDVLRPGVSGQQVERFGRESAQLAATLGIEPLDKTLAQQRNVFRRARPAPACR